MRNEMRNTTQLSGLSNLGYIINLILDQASMLSAHTAQINCSYEPWPFGQKTMRITFTSNSFRFIHSICAEITTVQTQCY